MINYWFTADTHVGHNRILEFCGNTRQGTTVEEHDEILIDSFNSVVKRDDILYMIGDEVLGDRNAGYNKLRRINCHKVLIKGNHTQIKEKHFDVFQSIHDYKEIRIEGIKVCMFHFPIWEFNDCHKGAFHLFGHVHGSYKTVRGKSLNVGIDQRPNKDMKPWSWEEIKEYMADKPIIEHHSPFPYISEHVMQRQEDILCLH